MKNAENPILSISLLTSDRMKTIPRCLESLVPLREAIPCELIIVDTSNNPEVHQYALSHTDLVEKFEWCNDFSKARNVGVHKAKGEWFMFIDDDEWFLEIEPLIDFFKSGEYKEYGYAHYKVRNYHDAFFQTYGDGWVTRLVKMHENTAFHSKVHEYLEPVTGKDKQINALIGHSGYAFTTIEARNKHFERNSLLLEKMEEEEPDNLRWKVQQIQEYRCVKEYTKLKDYCEKTIKYVEKDGRKVVLQELLQIYIGYEIALIHDNGFEKAVEVYKRYEHIMSKNLMAKAFMDVCVAEAYYNLKEYELMYKHAQEYLRAYRIFKRNPKEHEKDSLRLILGTAFSDERYCGANTMALIGELENQNYQSIYTYYPELKWGKNGIGAYCDIERRLIDALLKLDDMNMLKTVLQDGLSTSSIYPKMMKEILKVNDRDKNEYHKILELIKTIEIDSWYKPYAALLTVKETEDAEVVWKYAVEFIKKTPNLLEIPEEIRTVIEKYGFEVENLYKEFDFLEWKELLIDNLERMQMESVEKVKERLEKSSLRTDVRFGYFMIIYGEQKLLNGIDAELDINEYNELLYTYSQYTIETYEAMFAEQLQQMEIEDLPENYQAAMWLKLYFEEVNNNLQDALVCLGKAASAYPMFLKIIRYYISLLEKEFTKK